MYNFLIPFPYLYRQRVDSYEKMTAVAKAIVFALDLGILANILQ